MKTNYVAPRNVRNEIKVKIQWDLSLKNIRYALFTYSAYIYNNILAWARFLKSQIARDAYLLIWREKRLQVKFGNAVKSPRRLHSVLDCEALFVAKNQSRAIKRRNRESPVKLRICRVSAFDGCQDCVSSRLVARQWSIVLNVCW